MAETLSRYEVLDFSGGVRRDKSLFELDKNELLNTKNIEITERGRLKVRLGSQQLGNTLTGTIENSFLFVRNTPGSSPTTQFLVNNMASSAVISRLVGNRLTANAAVGDTTLTVNSSSALAASGTVEVDGDLIAYTGGGGGGTTLTGVTGITFAHTAGAAVNQWATLASTGVDGRLGITYAVLNNILFICGRAAAIDQYDGTNVTTISGEPSIILITNYRDRLYGAGDSANATNGDPRRVSFSARGDGTSWTPTSDFFDVEDQSGEYIMAFKVNNDVLGIFKTNSIFTYDEIELKQRVPGVGAYNQKVVQEIDEKIFTFCPNGIFETNLFSARSIGEPVRAFWENFVPSYGGSGAVINFRVCMNTFAWTSNHSYFLYIGDITVPYVASDVVLEYHTLMNNWTVHTGYTDFMHASSLNGFRFGDGALTARAAVFGGDTAGKAWRLYENRYLDNQATPVVQGRDVFQDLVSDTGSPASASFETPLYNFDQPDKFCQPGSLRLYVEEGQWMVEYRVENEKGIGPYKPLGSTSQTNKSLPFPSDAGGFRIGLRVSTVNPNGRNILNGFVFEKLKFTQRN